MSDEHVVLIKPTKAWVALNLRDLWHYRELLYFLTWRDIKVKYKQTLLGAAWAVLQPLFMMTVFTLFFGKMASVPSEGVPYPIFSYSGLLLWTYFAGAVSMASNSLIDGSNLITKIYFPRILMPISSTLGGGVDYIIALGVLVVMMIWYRITPGVAIVFLPFLLLCTFFTATGVGLWLSAMNVRYRDIRYVIPFFIQIWLFVTPVIYPSTFIHAKYRWLLSLNPMTGVIEAHRACILGRQHIDWTSLETSVGIIMLIFVSGLFYFKRMEKSFADVI